MSTKIWTAYRFPIERLREFQDTVRPHMLAKVIEWVEVLMPCVKPEVVESEMARYRKDGVWTGVFAEADTERHIRSEAVLKTVKQTRDEYGGSVFSLDCGFNVWLHEGLAYVIPWGQAQFYADLDVPKWAEDYHYQNSTDKPDGISKKAWAERAQTWETVALRNWNAHRLAFRVIDMSPDGVGGSEIFLHFLRQAKANKAASDPVS